MTSDHATTDTNPAEEPGLRSLPRLVAGLGRDTSRLVQDEIALAKAEIREAIAALLQGVAIVAAGGALALVGLFILLDALVRGLTSLLAQGMSLGVAVWLAPLIVAVVFGAAGLFVVLRGKAVLERASLTPRETVKTLQETKEWLKTRAK